MADIPIACEMPSLVGLPLDFPARRTCAAGTAAWRPCPPPVAPSTFP
jgi:hypothetical protein